MAVQCAILSLILISGFESLEEAHYPFLVSERATQKHFITNHKRLTWGANWTSKNQAIACEKIYASFDHFPIQLKAHEKNIRYSCEAYNRPVERNDEKVEFSMFPMKNGINVDLVYCMCLTSIDDQFISYEMKRFFLTKLSNQEYFILVFGITWRTGLRVYRFVKFVQINEPEKNMEELSSKIIVYRPYKESAVIEKFFIDYRSWLSWGSHVVAEYKQSTCENVYRTYTSKVFGNEEKSRKYCHSINLPSSSNSGYEIKFSNFVNLTGMRVDLVYCECYSTIVATKSQKLYYVDETQFYLAKLMAAHDKFFTLVDDEETNYLTIAGYIELLHTDSDQIIAEEGVSTSIDTETNRVWRPYTDLSDIQAYFIQNYQQFTGANLPQENLLHSLCEKLYSTFNIINEIFDYRTHITCKVEIHSSTIKKSVKFSEHPDFKLEMNLVFCDCFTSLIGIQSREQETRIRGLTFYLTQLTLGKYFRIMKYKTAKHSSQYLNRIMSLNLNLREECIKDQYMNVVDYVEFHNSDS